MNHIQSDPPRRALWLLRNACPGDNEALAGDLLERFHEGKSPGWFWKQVFIAIAVSLLGEIRRHWPHVCYALAGTWMLTSLWTTVDRVANPPIPWYALPWPWSMLVFESRNNDVLALAALAVLAAALAVNRTFRWVSLLRTGAMNFALITLGHYMPDAFPGLLRQVDQRSRVMIIPPVFLLLLIFLAFLVPARLGCRNSGSGGINELPKRTN